MRVGVSIERLGGHDSDYYQVTVGGEQASFSTHLYLGNETWLDIANAVERFDPVSAKASAAVHIGSFDPRVAGGAVGMRLLARGMEKVLLSVHAQGESFQFGGELVADEASFHLITEPALLDNFVSELRSMALGSTSRATLSAMAP